MSNAPGNDISRTGKDSVIEVVVSKGFRKKSDAPTIDNTTIIVKTSAVDNPDRIFCKCPSLSTSFRIELIIAAFP